MASQINQFSIAKMIWKQYCCKIFEWNDSLRAILL